MTGYGRLLFFVAAVVAAWGGAWAAGAEPAGAVATASAPAAAMPAEAGEVLKMLQDRKGTLKDFTAKVDYSVEHIGGDVDGKLGTVDYKDDEGGQKFSVDFTVVTVNGKPTHKAHSQLICDGKNVTVIDYDSKQYNQSPSPPTNSFKSELPLPIGIKVEEVAENFSVAVRPAGGGGKDGNVVTLRLTPLVKGRFEYTALDVSVDRKLQIPVKVVVYTNRGETTTIRFLEPEVNTGKAKVLVAAPPADPTGWTVNIGAGKRAGK